MVCVQRMVGFHNFLYTASKELLFATYYTLEILVFFYSMINQIQCKYKDIIIVCSSTRYLMENYAICCTRGPSETTWKGHGLRSLKNNVHVAFLRAVFQFIAENVFLFCKCYNSISWFVLRRYSFRSILSKVYNCVICT